MSDDGASFRATVAILTFNGETYLRQLLESVLAQEYDGTFEVLVIDSGSTDSTLHILEDFPSVRVHTIPNSEFGHGRTRNLAAQLADSTYIAFLTQDAIPADDMWLTELLAPLEAEGRIAIVTGRQTPRGRAFPLQKYEVVTAFDRLGPRRGFVIYRPEDAAADPGVMFHSDVNAAVRRDVVIDLVRFRDVPYAEDQILAKDIFQAGLWKAYAGAAAVVHSNDLTLAEYGPRIFDETVGLRRIGLGPAPLSRRSQFSLTVRGAVADSIRILRDRGMRRRDQLLWLLRNPAFHGAKWRYYRWATIVDLADSDAVAEHSLEGIRRGGAT